MKIGRILLAFMIVVLPLGDGLRAGQMFGCMEEASAIRVANDSSADAERKCHDSGQALGDAVTVCHGICLAPMISLELTQAYMPDAIFAVLHGAIEWRDAASSPDPHPPKATSHI